MTWTFAGNTNIIISIDPLTNIATFSAPQDWNGQEIITFTAADLGGLSDSDDLIVNVLPINDAPVVNIIPSVLTTSEDIITSVDLDDYVSDVDNTLNEITWTYSGDVNVHVNIDSDNIITFTANPNWNGQETITFTATDLGGLSDSDDVLVSVNPINDAPVLEDIHDITIDEDTIYTITSNGVITASNVTPDTPVLMTFQDYASPEYYVKLTDLAKKLGVNLDKKIWNCLHCAWKGHLKETERKIYLSDLPSFLRNLKKGGRQ